MITETACRPALIECESCQEQKPPSAFRHDPDYNFCDSCIIRAEQEDDIFKDLQKDQR